MKKAANKVPGFGKRLKKARLAAGCTQQNMADALGITLRNYQKYEAADTEPSLFNLITLSITLNVSSDQLLGITRADRAD